MNANDFIALFQSIGEQKQGSPLEEVLHFENKVLLIEEGLCEIFYSERIQSSFFSRKRNVITKVKGDIIFFSNPPKEDKLFILSMTSSTIYRIIPIEDLSKICRQIPASSEYVSLQINTAIKKLYSLMPNEEIEVFELLDQPGEYHFSPEIQHLVIDEETKPENEVLWVEIVEGEAIGFIIDEPNPMENRLMALYGNAYLRIKTDCKLNVYNTYSLVPLDKLVAIIDFINQVSAHIIKNFTLYELKKRFSRAVKKNEANKKSEDHVHQEVKSLIEKKEILSDLDTSSSILSALKTIAKKEKIEIEAQHIDLVKKEAPPEEILNAISQEVNFTYRTVSLSTGWENKISGDYILFDKEEGTALALIEKEDRLLIFNTKTLHLSPLKEYPIDQIEEKGFNILFGFQESKLSLLSIVRFGFKGFSKPFKIITILGTISTLLSLIIPAGNTFVFNNIIPEHDVFALTQYISCIIAILLCTTLLNWVKMVTIERASGFIDVRMQTAIWIHLMRLPMNFFLHYTSGDLYQRVLAINNIYVALGSNLISQITLGIFSFFYLIAMFIFNPMLAIWSIVITFFNILIVSWILYIRIKKENVGLDLRGKTTNHVLQIADGITKIRLSASEGSAYQFWLNQFIKLLTLDNQVRSLSNLDLIFETFMYYFTSFGNYILMFHLIKKMIDAHIDSYFLSIGAFIAFTSVFWKFSNLLRGLARSILNVTNIIPYVKRIMPIIQEKEEIDATFQNPRPSQGNLVVKDLTFSYNEAKDPVLDKISFELKQGESIAIVGESGGGKSTLIKLLLGFEKAKEGTICYDGQNLNEINLHRLRKQLGVVLQNPIIMSHQSILENICGPKEYPSDEVIEVVEKVGLLDDLKKMPMGFQTIISSHGQGFSGGQIQKISLARALIHRPKFLIFDEATSALDNASQKKVMENIDSLNVSRIIIAHRLSTIKNCDRIYVLKKGKFVESGTFMALSQQQGPFRELLEKQRL